ncbi:2OG-Fe(II) oxygenase [Thalassospira sp. MA62]|nr:2OG-Fe(II) oxygenase [Thalassospira sp. MA62]
MTGSATPSTRPPKINIWDFIPRIKLLDQTGKVIDLSDQLIAGSILALWILNDKPTKDDWALIDRFRAETPDTEVQNFLIISGKKSPKKDGKPGTKARELYDPENSISQLFGATAPAVALIDANQRLAAIDPFAGIDHTITVCQTIQAQSNPGPAAPQAPVLVMKDVLDPELCTDLLDYWANGEKHSDGVSQGAKSNSTAKNNIKKRNDVIVLDETLFNRVKAKIVSRLAPELFKAFHFKTASMEALRIGCYDGAEKGHFGRHRDNRTAFTAHRRFAVSLNLNPIDYEGGMVQFPEYGQTLYAPPPGGALVFSCSLLHEVMPVTKGKRYAMFTFLTDEAGVQAEQKLMAERQKQITPFAMKPR